MSKQLTLDFFVKPKPSLSSPRNVPPPPPPAGGASPAQLASPMVPSSGSTRSFGTESRPPVEPNRKSMGEPHAQFPRSPSPPVLTLKVEKKEEDDDDDDLALPAQMTPFLRQYQELRSRITPDTLLYVRKGRFFELYQEDAHFARDNFGLRFTKNTGAMCMCGVPDGQLDQYLRRTFALGKRVAVADEFPEQDPRLKIQRRDFTLVQSPGSASSALTAGTRSGILFMIDAFHSTKEEKGNKEVSDDLQSSEGEGKEEKPAATLDTYEIVFFDPLRRILLRDDDRIPLTRLGELLLWLQPGEILTHVDHPAHFHAFLRCHYSGPIFEYDSFFEDTCPTLRPNLLTEFSVSRCVTYYLAYLRQLASTLPPVTTTGFDMYLQALASTGLYKGGAVVRVPYTSLASLQVFPRPSTNPLDVPDPCLFDVYNGTATKVGATMLRTWLSCPLTDIETLVMRQEAISLFRQSPKLSTSLSQMRTDIVSLLLTCRNYCVFSPAIGLERAAVPEAVFVRTLLSLLETRHFSELLHEFLASNEEALRTNEMLAHFSLTNSCWGALEALYEDARRSFALEGLNTRGYKLAPNPTSESLVEVDKLLQAVQKRYLRFLNDLAMKYRLETAMKTYPIGLVTDSPGTVKAFTLTAFPDRHLSIGLKLVEASFQKRLVQKEGFGELSMTKSAGKYLVFRAPPTQTIAASQKASNAMADDEEFGDEALFKLLGVSASKITPETRTQTLLKALEDPKEVLDQELVIVEAFLLRRKNSHLNTIKAGFLRHAFSLQEELVQVVSIIAQVDVLIAFSQLETRYPTVSWCFPAFRRPLRDGEHVFSARRAYHPPALRLGQSRLSTWKPLSFDFERPCRVLTGCNMSGKSTTMRLVGSLALLAQIGAPVPAESLSLTPVTGILAHIGGEEDTRSTFQREATSCAELLLGATATTLCLLDEIGRGTDAETGDALAEAIGAYVGDLGAIGILSTHSTMVALRLEHLQAIQLCHMGYTLADKVLTFHHTLEDGLCARSFGIQVARLAGFDEGLLDRCEGHARSLIHSRLQEVIRRVDSVLGHASASG
ncbi:Mismatch repair protein [Giardia muris]|uniref:Mismatch repair protein n=1 Tax=Giardia muris TaxID=5742 RepID=A0A4Z1SPE3_GIAMU|nr:Mismatch repair protein [Giardia muris]|eukprot:TNJ27694.1 Mismatch repair protein [Giardia muris]